MQPIMYRLLNPSRSEPVNYLYVREVREDYGIKPSIKLSNCLIYGESVKVEGMRGAGMR